MMMSLVFAAGCAQGPETEVAGHANLENRSEPPTSLGANSHPVAPPTRPTLTTRVAGKSVEGRPIECRVLGDGLDVCMIIATIHGNEAAGTPLVRELEKNLLADPTTWSDTKVVIIPVANPDGMARSLRTNVRGVDLNRNFPADNFRGTRRHGSRPLSEPESRVLQSLIYEHAPSRVISIHQPVACIDWDGPAEKLALAMAAECDLPAKRIGSRPGSMGSWVGLDLKIPIITVELPRSADRLDDRSLWKRYGKMMLAAVTYRE